MKLNKVALILSLCFANQSTAHKHEVYLYNWDEFLSEEVISQLSDLHDITLKQQFFSDESIRDEVLLSERRGAFELVIIESIQLKKLANQNIFHNLSDLKETLASNFDKKWLDGCGPWGLPYAWGTSGILYRVDSFDTPTSWKTLLEPKPEAKGKISMYYEPTDLVGAALLVHKLDPFTNDVEELRLAYQTLINQKTFLDSNQYIIDYIDDPKRLANIDLAYGYSGDSYVLNEVENDSWAYSVPEEGTTLWLECIAAIDNGELSEQVKTTLSYLSTPEIAAKNAMDAWFATPSSRAKSLTTDAYKNDKELFPGESIIERSHLYKTLPPKSIQIRNRIIESLRN